MSTINDIIEEIEEELTYIVKDGKSITIREAIDSVLAKDKKKKRVLVGG